ncbi:MAG TPA: hypothetical protein VMW35_14055 [Myxococcota bacterium]|nr:hypothetical protein [Myxococcota bacterium]
MTRRALACLAVSPLLGVALLASPARAMSFGDVSVTISSAALGSATYLLFEFDFGIGPGGGTSSTPAGVTVKTSSNVTWGSPNETVPNTVNGFYSGNSTVSIGNYNQFVAKTGSTLGADYNKVLFLNLVSPSLSPIVFTLADPPGPATKDTPLAVHIAGPNNGPDLVDMSFLFRKDGSFSMTSLGYANGVSVTTQLVPEPSVGVLLLSGLCAAAAIGRRSGRS